MKRKVLVVATSNLSRGGIATVVSAISKQDVWTKYHCYWIKSHIDKSFVEKLLRLFCSLLKFCVLLPFYDIVHIHVSTTVSANRKYIFFKLAKLLRKKTIIHLHCGSQLSEIWNKKYADMLTNSDKCITLSKNIKNYIITKIGNCTNIEVLYNPCPDVSLKDEKNVDNCTILFAATLYKTKGYLDLIEAFGQIAAKYPNWKLLLAGNGDQQDGLELVKKYNIENQVEFLGWIKDDRKDLIFRTSTIFCLPSYAEGFPMAILDAWAYRLPIITTPVGGIPDIVVDGKNGLLVNPGDIINLANKLELLIKDQKLRKQIADESYKLSTTTFSLETMSKKLSLIYDSI